MKRFPCLSSLARLLSLAAVTCAVHAQPAYAQDAPPGDKDKGRAAFIGNGCWQCHGFQGQGGVTGPALAPDPKPFSFISVFVRNTNGAMPPYQKTVLSDADLADIYAYLQAQPKTRDYKSIPLLNSLP
jgi:ubiquinol-cytochrome c reductase cytochrome c subunit